MYREINQRWQFYLLPVGLVASNRRNITQPNVSTYPARRVDRYEIDQAICL